MSNKSFQDEVGEWGEATFPQSTFDSIVQHLDEEVGELAESVAVRHTQGVAEECADVYMLLIHLAHRFGIDLDEAARTKFARNKRRTWHDGGRGYARHVEEVEE